ncbi:MAG: DUF3148 domain-containing protein [Coleofasciculaceae cyanobacterium RL_1_1]|nr:DUF3148 domain-containing protein [Coleofasciculaceae cyanobacterium RL_1_1]
MSQKNSTQDPIPSIGQRVRIIALPPYVKTADPMPMLRPPSAISVGEIGIILARQPGNTWSIRFAKGAYLIDRDYFELLEAEDDTPAATSDVTGEPDRV